MLKYRNNILSTCSLQTAVTCQIIFFLNEILLRIMLCKAVNVGFWKVYKSFIFSELTGETSLIVLISNKNREMFRLWSEPTLAIDHLIIGISG